MKNHMKTKMLIALFLFGLTSLSFAQVGGWDLYLEEKAEACNKDEAKDESGDELAQPLR